MNFYLPDWKALCIAENATASLHNLLTPRGALVRDGRAWPGRLTRRSTSSEKRRRCSSAPICGRASGRQESPTTSRKQRDLYKYIHDQTVRLMNQGYTMTECAERIKLPPSLAREWYNRDFYGTVNFNVKAVYQRYLGWFDANPAHLHPLPTEEAARRYVEYMGGSKAVLARARQDMEKGDYRWVAEVVNHVVFADPATARPASCRRTPWSSSATSRNRPSGGISISPERRSSARGSRRAPPSRPEISTSSAA